MQVSLRITRAGALAGVGLALDPEAKKKRAHTAELIRIEKNI